MELDDLYQDIILDHYKHPRHYGPIPDAEVLVDEENPTCGDHIRLTARIRDGRVEEVRFDGKGCAISMASSSIMAEELTGKPVAEARRMAADFIAVLRGEKAGGLEEMGDAVALIGVKQFPLRVKCATLGWHAAQRALDRVAAAD